MVHMVTFDILKTPTTAHSFFLSFVVRSICLVPRAFICMCFDTVWPVWVWTNVDDDTIRLHTESILTVYFVYIDEIRYTLNVIRFRPFHFHLFMCELCSPHTDTTQQAIHFCYFSHTWCKWWAAGWLAGWWSWDHVRILALARPTCMARIHWYGMPYKRISPVFNVGRVRAYTHFVRESSSTNVMFIYWKLSLSLSTPLAF